MIRFTTGCTAPYTIQIFNQDLLLNISFTLHKLWNNVQKLWWPEQDRSGSPTAFTNHPRPLSNILGLTYTLATSITLQQQAARLGLRHSLTSYFFRWLFPSVTPLRLGEGLSKVSPFQNRTGPIFSFKSHQGRYFVNTSATFVLPGV